jgi:hypothetical protein
MRTINQWVAGLLFATATATITLAQGNNTSNNTPDPIIGTWVVKVPGATPEETFYAIHTFHQGGTFSENSTLFPLLVEGPAQGNWERKGDAYKLTFILFRFAEDGAFDGYVRVRNTIHLTGDRLDSETIVDLIEKDGSVIEAVATGPFFGLRQKADPQGSLADVPTYDSLSGDRGGAAGGVRNNTSSAASSPGITRKAVRRWSRFAISQ